MSYTDILARDKKIIIYRPELNNITGHPLATLLLCQIIYWSKISKHGEFYKNIYRANKRARENDQKSWAEELGFNRYQTEKALRILIRKDLIKVRIENSSHNTYVKLNRGKLEQELKQLYSARRQPLSPVVEGEQRGQVPVVEGEQPSIVEGEQPPLSKVSNRPLSKVNNGTITENTQRLHRDLTEISKSSILNSMEEENRAEIEKVRVKELFLKLSKIKKKEVIDQFRKYIKDNPTFKNLPVMQQGIFSAMCRTALKAENI